MEKIEITDITQPKELRFRQWLNNELALLWKVKLEEVEEEANKHFDNEHLAILYHPIEVNEAEKLDSLEFSDGETLVSVWHKTSSRPFCEWAKINGLDLFPRVMTGRNFTDKPSDYIYHVLPSDYVTSQLVRTFPASLKEILQWNDKTNFDDLIKSNRIKLYLRNAPSIKEWPESGQVYNHQGERLYCISPFRDLILVNDGSHFCCSAWHGFPSLGDPKAYSLDEIWNGNDAIEFRKSILDGSYRYCRHDVCPRLVNPENELQTVNELHTTVQHDVKYSGGELAGKFEFINYGFDPSCNLSCPSCRTDVVIAQGKAAEDIKFIEAQIEANGEDLKELYISGSGDAFGSPYARDFLSRMTEDNFPNLQSVLLHCNGQLFNAFIWNKLTQFVRGKISYVEISIDAASKETYEINRRGGSFEKLIQSLAFIRELKYTGALGYIKLSFVVQENNFDEMPEFVELAKEYDADCVFFSRLMNWGAFSNDEYIVRDIVNSKHPRFDELLEVLQDTRLRDSIVDFTNLGALVSE